jgi:amidohydrolase
MPDMLSEAQDLYEYSRSLRRDFHSHPELGYQEVRTAGVVTRTLTELGLEVTSGIGQTGVVALLEGKQPGPVVMLRFDMDALPIVEETGAEYASQNLGVMHACGHDAHTAIGLTVARILHNHRQEFYGTVKFVFQPAEEALGGAESMIAAGVLDNPKPNFAIGVHVWNEKPLGWVGIAPGPVMAAADMFTVRITGRGGHGALPNLTVDPVVASAQVINALQSIVSRNVAPLQSGVVSVTAIHGGEAFNVIPPFVELRGTIRAFEPEVHTKVLKRFEEIINGISAAMGCKAEIEISVIAPAVINDPDLTNCVQASAAHVLPHEQLETGYRTMGSEDFAYYSQQVPGCFILIGSANSEKGLDAPHHHPCFDIDEGVLPKAAALMAGAALDLLQTRDQ